MNIDNDEIKALLVREKIRDTLASLARGEDRRDADLIAAAFWPDANVDFGIFAGNFDDYLAWVVPGSPAVLVTQHALAQSLIAIDIDIARVETHVNSYHRVNMGEAERDLVISGRYLDRFEQRNGEWRIAQRTMLYDWSQDFGVSVDWSQGLMGTPFSGTHYTGVAIKDFSEIFFGKASDNH